MSKKDFFGFVLSIGMIAAMWWGCSFELEQMMMGELVKAAGGKYKFLTILNMYLQMFYFALCVVDFFFGSNTIEVGKCSRLQKFRDVVFASAAFPLATFVCITFWGIYNFDRQLIFPQHLDGLVSPTLNHVMHTLPCVAIWLENLFHNHHYPSRRVGLSIVLLISAGYTAWIHYLHHLHWLEHQISLWVYPILDQLSMVSRSLFLLGSTFFNVGLYFIGEMYTLLLTSSRLDKFVARKKNF